MKGFLLSFGMISGAFASSTIVTPSSSPYTVAVNQTFTMTCTANAAEYPGRVITRVVFAYWRDGVEVPLCTPNYPTAAPTVCAVVGAGPTFTITNAKIAALPANAYNDSIYCSAKTDYNQTVPSTNSNIQVNVTGTAPSPTPSPSPAPSPAPSPSPTVTPTAPSNLTGSAASSSQINLTWTDHATNETGFTLERATNSGFTTGLTTVSSGISANSTSYSVTGLTASTTYYFRVKATNAVGSSTYATSAAIATSAASVSIPNNYGTVKAVQLSATVNASPAQITLRWSAISGRTVNSIQIWRRTGTGTAPTWTSVATPAASATSWTDSVSANTYYEYKVYMSTTSGDAYGYIASGVNLAQETYRGKIVVLVDSSVQATLTAEINALLEDLQADKWIPILQPVSRTATPVTVRNTLKALYAANPDLKSVYILGHVPVASLGNNNPDGHAGRGFSSDNFYGEMTSTWNNVTGGCAGYTWSPQQAPGIETPSNDARFCASSLPSTVELEVGRVDMSGITAFGGTEVSLLANYLNKASQYKRKQWAPIERAFIKDGFDSNGWSMGKNAWSTFPSMVGAANITVNNGQSPLLHQELDNNSYQFVYGTYYGGSCQGSANDIIGSTARAAASQWGGVFNMLFGSYFGEINCPNGFLRSVLASGKALASVYGGDRYWYFHSMGMGKTLGYASLMSVSNSSSLYLPVGGAWDANYNPNGYMTLVGDPTVRMSYVARPSALTISNSGGKMNFTWTASSEGQGYNIYEIQAGTIRKVNTTVITTTSFLSNDAYAVGKKYMVTAVATKTSAGGTYYNESLGTLKTN